MAGNTVAGSKTGSGTNDNDIVMQITNALPFDVFHITSETGAMDVFVSLDGTNFSSSPLSLTDQGGIASDPVVVSAPNKVYGFRGKYSAIRIQQTGATAVTGASMTYGVMGG